MKELPSFLFTGANFLPIFMLIVDKGYLPMAMLSYVVLALSALYLATRDEATPVRAAAPRRIRRPKRDDSDR